MQGFFGRIERPCPLQDVCVPEDTPRVRSVTWLWLVAFAVAASSLGAGCGKKGGERFSGLSTYEPADGSFLIRYRKPPWHILGEDDTGVYFEVLREGAKFVDIDAGLLPVTRKYFLRARVVARTPAECLDDALALKPADAELLEGPEELMTVARNTGTNATFRYYEDEQKYVSRYVRIACIEHPTGSLELYFDTIPDPREAEVDEMIATVEVQKP